jgi:hypothetical protein
MYSDSQVTASECPQGAKARGNGIADGYLSKCREETEPLVATEVMLRRYF